MELRSPPHTPDAMDRLVRELLEEDSSQPVSDDEIRRRYPDDCEGLVQALHDARAISEAARRARESREESADEEALAGEEDFSLLQKALPDFEFLDLVGAGGQGAVYQAVQKSTRRTVALKVLLGRRLTSSHHTQRFSREIEIVSQLRHPNIVPVYESGFVLGRPYYAMEFIEGMPIDDYVLVHQPSVKDRVKLLASVCRAVSHAHQRGVIHRDLKSANVLVDLDGVPHVLDFGLAKFLHEKPDEKIELSLSLPGQVLGTLPYLSPEQAMGRPQDVDTRSDVYSLGVILYQILTGALPYPLDGTHDSIRLRIANDDPMSFRKALTLAEPPTYDVEPDLPDDLEQVVRKALAKNQERRYQSADALADDLDRFIAGQAVGAKADSAFYLLRKTVRRYRVQFAVAGAFVAMLVVALAGMFFLWQRSDRLARMYQTGLQVGAYMRLANIARDQGRLTAAHEMFRKALDILAMISEPDETMIHWTYDNQQDLAELALEEKDMTSARLYAEALLAMARQKLAADPNDAGWQRRLGAALRVQGKVEYADGLMVRALASFDGSRIIRESLFFQEPDNETLRRELASIYCNLGDCYRKLCEFDDSYTYYLFAYDIQKRVFDENPPSLSRAIDLSFDEYGLASWYMVQRTTEDNLCAESLFADIEDRLAACENSQSWGSRAWDIARLRKAIRQNLRTIKKRPIPDY